MVNGSVLITGDEHPDISAPIDTLVIPIDAPWIRATDHIAYVQRVRPRRVIAVHDGLVNDDGLAVARAVLGSPRCKGVDDVIFPAVGEKASL